MFGFKAAAEDVTEAEGDGDGFAGVTIVGCGEGGGAIADAGGGEASRFAIEEETTVEEDG